MTPNTLINAGMLLMAAAIVVISVVLAKMNRLPKSTPTANAPDSVATLQRLINELEQRLLKQQEESSAKVRELEQKVSYLQTEDLRKGQLIIDLQRQISEERTKTAYLQGQLEKQATAQSGPVSLDTDELPLLLAVIGADPALKVDLAALREVEAECGLEITRCYPARFYRFEAILNRYRDTNPIQYVHFSIHSTPGSAGGNEGPAMLFEGGLVDGTQLSGVLKGVQIVMIAGCESDMLGDLLGVVPVVVTFREPLEHRHGHEAAKLFWSAVGRGLSPRMAYRDARSKMPSELAEAMEFHARSLKHGR